MDELAKQSPAITEPDAGAPDKSKAVPKSTDMHIKVYSPFHVYFDDRANSISALNDTGPFDILPGHSNFMTLVSACELNIITSKGEEKIKIARAVMHVKADEVRVFLDV
jgi:F0F1-type ATP synthase epsilon subunit